jgi:hypothetical protein
MNGSSTGDKLGRVYRDATAVVPSVAPPKIVAVVGSPVKKSASLTPLELKPFVRRSALSSRGAHRDRS